MEDKKNPGNPGKSKMKSEKKSEKSRTPKKPKHFPSRKEERTPGVKKDILPHDPLKSTKATGGTAPGTDTEATSIINPK